MTIPFDIPGFFRRRHAADDACHPATSASAEETALARRLAQGDKEALDGFVRTYAPRLYAAFLAVCDGHAADAQDLTWRTLETGYRKIASFRGRSSLFSWLYRIGQRFRQMSRRAKTRAAEDLMPELPDTLPDARPTPPETAAAAETAERLERALATLPAAMRDTVNLRFTCDLTVSEIADCLGVREGTVKSRLHYALSRLRTLLDESGEIAPPPPEISTFQNAVNISPSGCIFPGETDKP